MKCTVCNQQMGQMRVIRNGRICGSCLGKLPRCAREQAAQLSDWQIRRIIRLFHAPSHDHWLAYNWFRISDHAICFSDREIELNCLNKIWLGFHLNGQAGKQAKGRLLLCIESREPGIIFREELFPYDIAVPYQIRGTRIYYGFPPELVDTVNVIQKALDQKRYDLSSFRENPGRKNSKTREQEKTGEGKEHENFPESELEKAMKLYSVSIPYTEKQIRHIRNELIKRNHPDVTENGGGDAEKCREILQAYQFLLKYISPKTGDSGSENS